MYNIEEIMKSTAQWRDFIRIFSLFFLYEIIFLISLYFSKNLNNSFIGIISEINLKLFTIIDFDVSTSYSQPVIKKYEKITMTKTVLLELTNVGLCI